ncbi:MurR/RpiR family transcriptional regulator [Streptantibioticus cattleyicolor]|uniref:RpiR family transcriptional regulator n=1 Tax=Streptantibioticus cattleyicolor (strain ATCC 35852 / DSM 46488 / JCM 4925 / NBRC 14057 / NRRL 8057) TaxID=1003195 RepID=F8JKN1_STREN|nr:MurR/RpiR family transcriptional regulator [Streptantibioticus cattleyicolor]AEW98478.1 RpiR family transcriptional regulator [Streptantibioticus cattleyicolor NRRL 8057 = DSM 46488]CCB72465.1 Transcriptional regulator (modular protein) [Streptantibioticus cattleyicolor NRRL 8057 = DSM 46488]
MEGNSGSGERRLSAHVRAQLSGLRDTEARVARVVLDKGADLVHLSVSDVAALAGTAPSSVVRACQRLGFRGYQELKIAAAREAPAATPSSEPDPAARALADTVRAAREALDGLATTLPASTLRQAAEALAVAPSVLVVGAGLSGAVALDAAYRLRALGLVVDAPADPLTAQLAASQLAPAAVCLAVSHTGATRSTVDAARRARTAGAAVISLTSYARSPLSETSTHTLVAGGQDLVFGLETVASRLAHLAVVDALTLTLRTLRGAAAETALRFSADVTADHAY